jgi:hypothetical protein
MQRAPRHERRVIDGPVGAIEIALDWPAAHADHAAHDRAAAMTGAASRVAFIGHPHPLYGGTLDNKVAATLARAFAGCGWLAVRPNFRGVGGSAGEHDHGHGESEDFLHVIDTLPQWLGRPPAGTGVRHLALAGFSFGSYVAARTAAALKSRGQSPEHLVLVGAAAGKWPLPEAAVPPLVIHGELDETIPLADVLDWARPQEIPVIVLPGADHFFHRRLAIVKRLVGEHLDRAQPNADADRIDGTRQTD